MKVKDLIKELLEEDINKEVRICGWINPADEDKGGSGDIYICKNIIDIMPSSESSIEIHL